MNKAQSVLNDKKYKMLVFALFCWIFIGKVLLDDDELIFQQLFQLYYLFSRMQSYFFQGKSALKRREPLSQFKHRIGTHLQGTHYTSLLLFQIVCNYDESRESFLHFLLEYRRQGADPNFTHHNKSSLKYTNPTIVMTACQQTSLSIVEILFNHKEEPKLKDAEGNYLTHYACRNRDENQCIKIISMLFSRYPQLRTQGDCSDQSYTSIALSGRKYQLLKYLLSEGVEIQTMLGQNLLLHKVMEWHSDHKNKEITIALLRIIIVQGYREDSFNEKQQNYITFAINTGILSQQEITEMMKQIKPQPYTKQLTLQTSPEEKLTDQNQEQDFWDSLSSNNQHSLEEESHSDDEEQVNHFAISEEMIKIAEEVEAEYQKTWAILYPFYAQVYAIATQLYGTIQFIGSFASKLWIPNCDIDLLIIIPEQNSEMFDDIVQHIFRKIKSLSCHSFIRLSLTYKLPLVKLVLNNQHRNLQVEIFLSNKKNIASQYVAYIHNAFQCYPQMYTIYIVLRKLLQTRQLHDHKKGGLKAYGLFLLVYSMRLQYQYAFMSQFLQHFAYYYGLEFEYVGEMIGGEINYKININDPLNYDNNMGGKNTNIILLQEILKKSYYCMNLHNEGKKIQYILKVLKEI